MSMLGRKEKQRAEEMAGPTANFPLPNDSEAMERFLMEQLVLGEHALEGVQWLEIELTLYILCKLALFRA